MLYRTDGEIKLHPFCLYEGSDARQNLENTLGKYTKEIRSMGKEVSIGGKSVKLKFKEF